MERPFIINNIPPFSFSGYDIFFDSPYKHSNIVVPRVTTILSEMLHEEYLMNWANFMGRVKHVDHNKHRDNAAHIGTKGHEAIESFILSGNIDTFDDELVADNKMKMKNVLSSFISWWNIVNIHKVEILMMEQSLSCELYGGTLDLLIRVDGKIYLVDLKTSNHFNYKYHLQTAAYRRMLWLAYNILIDGVIILKLSKDEDYYEEQLIDLSIYNQLKYMDDCDRCFLSLAYAYHNRKLVESQYKRLYGKR